MSKLILIQTVKSLKKQQKKSRIAYEWILNAEFQGDGIAAVDVQLPESFQMGRYCLSPTNPEMDGEA